MKDAAHLTKLLRHADPVFFRSVLTTQYEVELPKINSTLGKQVIRKSFAEAMTFLPFSRRRELDEWAERINLLADTAGREAVESVRLGDLSDEQREAYGQLNNQYDRSLWLSAYAADIFREAIGARDVNVLRQSTLCYSGFEGPARLALKEDKASLSFFHHKVAEWLACPREDIAIEVFKRFSPDSETDEDVALYQVSIHYNLAPETVECVKKSQLDSAEVTRAVSTYITYEPSSGQIDVLSRNKIGREAWARLVADLLLKSPITGGRVPLLHYDYQCLSRPFTFDIADENIDWVKVTQLGYSKKHRALDYKIGVKDARDIHTAATVDIAPGFQFSKHRLTLARITLRIRKQPGERARTLHIVLRHQNGCSINNAKREKDRALCKRLLAKWGIVKEVGDAYPAQEYDTSAH